MACQRNKERSVSSRIKLRINCRIYYFKNSDGVWSEIDGVRSLRRWRERRRPGGRLKVFLAGCEAYHHFYITAIAEVKHTLFSYYHWQNVNEPNRKRINDLWINFPQEVIIDSGLFTLMFGAGKGGSYDMQFMKEYTRKYIDETRGFSAKKMSIVESDVHKLLGMRAVFELRKYFEDSGMNVIYVWHREEGIDGLYEMAEKYDYIAISVPELRILCKGKFRYQDAVKDLERKIFANVKRMPKIHLLGNTVMETMQTNYSYSCDSSSWLAGAMWGRFISFENGRLRPKKITSMDFEKARYMLQNKYKNHYSSLIEEASKRGVNALEYSTKLYLSAQSYAAYQAFLDKKFKCKAVK